MFLRWCPETVNHEGLELWFHQGFICDDNIGIWGKVGGWASLEEVGHWGGLFLVAKSFSAPWLNLCSLLSEVTVWTALSHDAHPIMMNSRPKQNPSFIAVLDVLSQNTEVGNVIPYYLESKYFQIKMSFLTCLVSTQLPALFPGRPLLYKLPLL